MAAAITKTVGLHRNGPDVRLHTGWEGGRKERDCVERV